MLSLTGIAVYTHMRPWVLGKIVKQCTALIVCPQQGSGPLSFTEDIPNNKKYL